MDAWGQPLWEHLQLEALRMMSHASYEFFLMRFWASGLNGTGEVVRAQEEVKEGQGQDEESGG